MLCAFFVAIAAILAQIQIPIGTVPVNFVHIAIFMSAALLGKWWGSLSMLVYVLLGAAGTPVFSGFLGGISIIAGPTGGFIVGYILCAFVTGLVIEKLGCRIVPLIVAILLGWVVTYIPGLLWFMYVTGTPSFLSALLWCFVPFIPGDVIKSVLCIVLIPRLRPLVAKRAETKAG